MNIDDLIERKARLASSVITNTRFNYAKKRLNELRDKHLWRKEAGRPIGEALTIQGLSGSGKTTLLERFEAEHRRQFGDEYPIVRFTLPPNCTPKQLAIGFAVALNDCLASRSTQASVMRRIRDMVTDRGICMVCIDEVQHLRGKTKPIVNHDAADTLKVLLSELTIPFVLVGTPELQSIIDSNTQLRRRMAGRVDFHPFDVADRGDFREWTAILRKLDEHLPFERSSRLYDRVLAQAIHTATGGLVGRVVQLIRLAGAMAIDDGALCIGVRHLEAARDELASTEEMKEANPFEKLMDAVDEAA